jgi:TATA-box binding protein (TBP) (component of TFIID and TFIIIB)
MSLVIDREAAAFWPKYVPYTDKPPDTYLYDKNIIVIVNTVYTFVVCNETIDLNYLTKKLACAFNIKNKPCTIRLYPIRCTALVYAKGHVVIIGNQTHYTAIYAARLYTRMVSRILNKKNIMIQNLFLKNITATTNLPFRLDIDSFRKEYKENTEIGIFFPGLRFRLRGPKDKVVQILFQSSILITGAKSIKQIVEYYRESLALYEQHVLDYEKPSKKVKKLISKEDKDYIDDLINNLTF